MEIGNKGMFERDVLVLKKPLDVYICSGTWGTRTGWTIKVQ
jgi:hypothetical protein